MTVVLKNHGILEVSYRRKIQMVKILMHGCNGKMGRMITEIVKNEEDAVIAAGVDKFTGIPNDYPVFEKLTQ